jgi:hypothetical protein
MRGHLFPFEGLQRTLPETKDQTLQTGLVDDCFHWVSTGGVDRNDIIFIGV